MKTKFLIAQKLYEAGEYIAAEEKFLSLIKDVDVAADAYLMLSRILFDREEYRTSLRYLVEAKEKNLSTIEHDYLAGLNHYALKDLPKASSAFKDILNSDPKNKEGHRNLGIISEKQGNVKEAASYFCDALEIDPSDKLIRRNLFKALELLNSHNVDVRHLLRRVRPHVEASLKLPEFDLKRYLQVVTSVVYFSEHVLFASQKLGSAVSTEPKRSGDRSWIIDVCRDELFQYLLRCNILPYAHIEIFLTQLRRCLLEIASNDKEFLSRIPLEFCISMSHQAYLTEYAYNVNKSELNLLNNIQNELLAKIRAEEIFEQSDVKAIAIISAYISIDDWIDEAPKGQFGGALSTIFKSQVYDRKLEADLLNKIENLSNVTNETSIKVRNQYEENPFPRWSSIPIPRSTTIGEALQTSYPHFRAPAKLFEECSILIAGCGTGQQPIHIALRYPNCQLMAIDLSLKSLASAMRRSIEYDVSNVRFLQADILKLNECDDNFDFISCTGVLHHMADPIAGWRVLVSKLSPGGVMKIGIYSEIARRHISEVRDWISELGITPTEENIREVRQRLFKFPKDDTRRRVLEYSDFYSVSGARDLLFHVEEHTFTFEEISAVLDTLGLELIGLQLTGGDTEHHFREMFPEDPNMQSLLKWHEFEKVYPDSFRSMYQFWCRHA